MLSRQGADNAMPWRISVRFVPPAALTLLYVVYGLRPSRYVPWEEQLKGFSSQDLMIEIDT
jgi:hypothetical protein